MTPHDQAIDDWMAAEARFTSAWLDYRATLTLSPSHAGLYRAVARTALYALARMKRRETDAHWRSELERARRQIAQLKCDVSSLAPRLAPAELPAGVIRLQPRIVYRSAGANWPDFGGSA